MEELKLEEHLGELRRRLIIILVFFVLSFACSFAFVPNVYDWIVETAGQQLAILGPSDILWIYFTLAGSCALIVTTPLILYHLWRFVEPAITTEEKGIVCVYIPAVFLFFIIGILFGYFILFPSVLAFLQTLAEDHLVMMYTAERYFGFLFNLTIPIGLLFEIPILIILLTRLGLLNPARLAKTRKIAYFVLTLLATLVTPPDLISALIVLAPLALLYEMSISISKVVYKRRLARLAAISET